MDLIPNPKRERLYFIIHQADKTIKFFDTYLKIMFSEKEFKTLTRNNYYENITLIFDNHLEQ